MLRSGCVSRDTLTAGGTLHLTSVAPQILNSFELGCTLNGKIGNSNPGFSVEGFLWVAFPFSGGKRKNLSATSTPPLSWRLSAKFHLKLRFATNNMSLDMILCFIWVCLFKGLLCHALGGRGSLMRTPQQEETVEEK